MPNITAVMARLVALERRLEGLKGGSAGQVLTKLSAAKNDYGWVTLTFVSPGDIYDAEFPGSTVTSTIDGGTPSSVPTSILDGGAI